MNKRDEAVVDEAFWILMRRVEDTPRFQAYQERCMRAVAGAAGLLRRDPEELARLLSDGRLAYYLRDAEQSIPLSLDDPAPTREALDSILTAAADKLDEARERLSHAVARIDSGIAAASKELRIRAVRERNWRFGGQVWSQPSPEFGGTDDEIE